MKRKVYKKSYFGRISDDVRGFGIQHEESCKINEAKLKAHTIRYMPKQSHPVRVRGLKL